MEFSEKIISKKEEILDEFEELTLKEIAVKIKQASNRNDGLIFKIACLAARVSVLNQRIKQLLMKIVLMIIVLLMEQIATAILLKRLSNDLKSQQTFLLNG